MSKIDPPFFIAIGASGSEGLDDIRDLLGALITPVQAIVMVVLHRPTDKISHLHKVFVRAPSHLASRCSGLGHGFPTRHVPSLFSPPASHPASKAIGIVLSGSLDDG